VQKALIPKEGGEKEFIDTVNYLLESRYITGRTVHLDGGRHLK
jgi:dihydromonapterin reductase/dihydrofolate reductase